MTVLRRKHNQSDRGSSEGEPFLSWERHGLHESGKTKVGLAHALKISPGQVTLLLQGERRIRADELDLISKYIGEPVPMVGIKRSNHGSMIRASTRLPMNGYHKGKDGKYVIDFIVKGHREFARTQIINEREVKREVARRRAMIKKQLEAEIAVSQAPRETSFGRSSEEKGENGEGSDRQPLHVLLTSKEVAAQLRISPKALRSLVADGVLPRIVIGRGSKRPRYRFDPDDIERFKRERRQWIVKPQWQGKTRRTLASTPTLLFSERHKWSDR